MPNTKFKKEQQQKKTTEVFVFRKYTLACTNLFYNLGQDEI